MNVYSSFRRTVPAGEQQLLDIHGRYVACLEANIEFKLGVDDVDPQFMAQGLQIEVEGGQHFKKLVIDNSGGGVDLTVRLGIGSGRLQDNRLSSSAPLDLSNSAGLSTTADVGLTAVTATQIVAANSNRRRAIITNLATNTAVIRVGDSNVAASRGTPIYPGEAIELDTEAAVYGYSVPGESVAVAEVTD